VGTARNLECEERGSEEEDLAGGGEKIAIGEIKMRDEALGGSPKKQINGFWREQIQKKGSQIKAAKEEMDWIPTRTKVGVCPKGEKGLSDHRRESLGRGNQNTYIIELLREV